MRLKLCYNALALVCIYVYITFMSAEKILKTLESGTDRAAKTVYLSKRLVTEAESVSNAPISRLIEALLKDFIENVKGSTHENDDKKRD